ncbi:hypothetical protein BKA80DRAFT_270073 [Phyllosticta citrichinensis]
MRAVQGDTSLSDDHKSHRLAILRFMDSLAKGHLSSIAVGQGGTALKKREDAGEEKKRSYVGGNGNWHFGAMNMGVPSRWSWKHKPGSAAAVNSNSNSNANANSNSANTKALTTTTTTANKASTVGKGARDPEAAELTRPERWVYRWMSSGRLQQS